MIQNGPNRNWHFGFLAWGILLLTSFLLLLGYANLVNTDFYSQTSLHYRQALWILVGLVVMAATTLIDRSIIELFTDFFYWIVVILLLIVLFAGHELNHSRRWLFLWGIALEPSEFAKPAVMLLVAKHLHYARRTGTHTIKSLLSPFARVLLPVILIMMEPDLGTAIILMLLAFSIFLFDGIRLNSLLMIIGVLLVFVPLAWYTGIIRDYQKARIKVWLHLSDKDSSHLHRQKGMQPKQALWAVGSGGIDGKGALHASQSRLKYLAEMHTDFIFGIFAEERGFTGSMALVFAYMALVLMTLGAAIRARERFGALACAGTAFYLFWQSLLNLAMVTGLAPVVGLTLPMMSYGGSSMLTTLFSIGLVLNVSVFD